jgi:M6 family metalloprotease-like protein
MTKRNIYIIAFVLLTMLFSMSSTLGRNGDAQKIQLKHRQFMTESMNSSRVEISDENGFVQIANPIPDTLRVLAIRVDFIPDTLDTTTGDGSFFYDMPDDEYLDPENWIVDRPPHDKEYFEDQLLAMRNYFYKFSHGKVVLTGASDDSETSGGDVFPPGDQEALRLPYQMWEINYNNGDNEHLNQKLVDLFVDSWKAADTSRHALFPNEYDVFVIFHAGAGNEFDTGYDTSPHDIPSVYIGKEDLEIYADSTDSMGVSVRGRLITEGVILPSMQKQGDVDVGLLGTICAQVGYLLGMPHLYNSENADPGIGLFGLMDRGFGAYFGANPTPPSAWTRAFMRWDSVTTVNEGEIKLGALHLPNDHFEDGILSRLVRVPINENEYYLLEARQRDPEDDSLTYAYDRDGRRMTLNNDYSFEAEDGFRVAVDIEDHDFDLPASGILIWHIDDNVIRAKIEGDDLQNDPDYRAVDLEEADGTQDIGEEYGFLQVGDGAEYGVREDAWYVNNEIWQDANSSIGTSSVEFSSRTEPSTSANTGGMSHLTITDFSAINDTMTATVLNAWKQSDYPRFLPFDSDSEVEVMFVDVDGDSASEVVVYNKRGTVWVYNGDGTPIGQPYYDLSVNAQVNTQNVIVCAADVDGDFEEEIFIVADDALVRLDYQSPTDVAASEIVRTDRNNPISMTIAGPNEDGDDPYLITTYMNSNKPLVINSNVLHGTMSVQEYLNWPLVNSTVLLAGEGWSSNAVIVLENGQIAVFDYNESPPDFDLQARSDILEDDEVVTEPVSADFDGNGVWEIVAKTSYDRLIRWNYALHTDLIDLPQYGESPLFETASDTTEYHAIADIDMDGFPELVTHVQAGNLFVGIETGGIYSSGTPIEMKTSFGEALSEPLIADLDGNEKLDLIFIGKKDEQHAYVTAINLETRRPLKGFPIDFGYTDSLGIPSMTIGQLDRDVDLEIAIVTDKVNDRGGLLTVLGIPTFTNLSPEVVWGTKNGNVLNSRHHGEPTIPSISNSINLDNAYVWPNPIYDDIAHFRFTAGFSGTASVKIFDLVGRQLIKHEGAYSGVGECEINVNISDLVSGVYVARLEVAGEYSIIRLAVVR